jgi:hypothetical protein
MVSCRASLSDERLNVLLSAIRVREPTIVLTLNSPPQSTL